jgi:hypothetical protein
MGYIGKKPTPVPLTASDVTDGIISNAKLAQDIISAETELAVAPADTDELLVSDAGTLKRVDFSLLASTPHKTLLSTTTLSGDTEVAFDNTLITSTYRDYYVTFSNVHLSTDAVVEGRVSTDNGSTYKSDANYQRASFGIASDATTIVKNISNVGTQWTLTGAYQAGGGTGENFNAEFYFNDFLGTDNYKLMYARVVQSGSSGDLVNQAVSGSYKTTSAINAFKIFPGSGNFASGTVKFYGIT